MPIRSKLAGTAAALLLASTFAGLTPATGQARQPAPPPPRPTYADLADLADSAPLAIRAQVRSLIRIEPARAPGVRPGWARFYVEARTRALLSGNAVLGESLKYLVDLPLDSRGRPPALKKKDVLIFARTVAGRPGELQLASRDSQIPWDAETETRLRAILVELLAPGAPGRISGVREAIHIPGTLAGEGETQMFLATPADAAASIQVSHRQGQPPSWGVSFSEVLEGGRPPARDTLAWYRLACFLPNALPQGVNLSESARDRAQADSDYRMVLGELGECPRTRR